jgi:type IV fimbrial biogenesis protein FimT
MVHRGKGFTLIEMLITIAVGAITLTWAVQSARSIIVNNRLTSQANDFITALQFARSEALKRGSTVTVCSSSTLTSCASSTTWSGGYIVFADADGDATVDTGETVLKKYASLAGTPTFTGNTNNVRYLSSGFSREFTQSSPTSYAFTLSATGCAGNESRVIDINPIGRPLITKSSC